MDEFKALRERFYTLEGEERVEAARQLRALYEEMDDGGNGYGCGDYERDGVYPCPSCEQSGWSGGISGSYSQPAEWVTLGTDHVPLTDEELAARTREARKLNASTIQSNRRRQGR